MDFISNIYSKYHNLIEYSEYAFTGWILYSDSTLLYLGKTASLHPASKIDHDDSQEHNKKYLL